MASPPKIRRQSVSSPLTVAPPKPSPPKSKKEQLVTDRLCAGATNVAREAALAFLDADANNDGSLDSEEFEQAIARMRSVKGGAQVVFSDNDREQIRILFESIECAPTPERDPVI